MIERREIKEILEKNSEYRDKLFIRGYLITDKDYSDNMNDYPFYSNWKNSNLGKSKTGLYLNLYVHKKLESYSFQKDNITVTIIGHAYNPFSMIDDENSIIEDLYNSYKSSLSDFFSAVSELTGIHVIIVNDNGNLITLQDCGGIKTCYYGLINKYTYITSHPQLVADLLELKMDSKISVLMGKWFFSLSGRYLPGNLSPFRDLRRLGPNTFVEISNQIKVERFYPIVKHPELNQENFHEIIEKISILINRNIELASNKWKRPSISLSGGMDSKTTLACANGLYDKFSYYSFNSKPQELEDANAAHNICKELGINHDIYSIPTSNDDFNDFETFKKIIYHNASYIDQPKDNEIRKFIYLSRLNTYDVELKSWISEVGRAMWGKKYGISLPDRLTARHFSIFQTRYFGSPQLLKHSDNNYEEYLRLIDLENAPFNYNHADMFYWEFRFGSWGANVATTHDIFNHIVTIPMNNRKILDMFLWFPYEFRHNDGVNKGIINYFNKELGALDFDVKNMYLRKNRTNIEKLYYYYRIFMYKMKRS